VVCLGIMNKSASEVWDKKESSEVVKHQTLPFMDRKTTVFVDIARAKPKSQSCNKPKKKTEHIEIHLKIHCSLKAWQTLSI